MRKKKRNVSGTVEKWRLDFLLDGILPDKSLGFAGFCFSHARPNEAPCRWGAGPRWWDVWNAVKDGPVVQAWRMANPGQRPYAEKLLRARY
jgi:hypothetical protein